jgi:hypothetical protein
MLSRIDLELPFSSLAVAGIADRGFFRSSWLAAMATLETFRVFYGSWPQFYRSSYRSRVAANWVRETMIE